MDSDINPTLLLGIIGGVLLLGATTMINGTIWATSIDMTRPGRDIDSVNNGTTQNGDGWTLAGEYAPFRAADTAQRAIGRRRHMPRNVPVDCVQAPLGPGDELLDMVCEHYQ